MKFIFALLIASQAIIVLNGQLPQERENTFGTIQRDSVVRQTYVWKIIFFSCDLIFEISAISFEEVRLPDMKLAGISP